MKEFNQILKYENKWVDIVMSFDDVIIQGDHY